MENKTMTDNNQDYHIRVDFPPFCPDELAWAERRAKHAAAKLLAEKLLPNRWFAVRLRQSWNFDAEKIKFMAALTIPRAACWLRYDIDIGALEERTIITGLPSGVLRDFANQKYSLRQRIVFAWRALRGLEL